jgi:hypothetical protein
MSVYGLSVTDMINLSGGIPSENITDLEIKLLSKSAGVMSVQINTNFYQTNRVIDFELGIINNSFMHVLEGRKGF